MGEKGPEGKERTISVSKSLRKDGNGEGLNLGCMSLLTVPLTLSMHDILVILKKLTDFLLCSENALLQHYRRDQQMHLPILSWTHSV